MENIFMTKRKTFIGGGVLLLLASLAWVFGFVGGTDPAIAKLNDMRSQMGDKNLTDAQRSALRGEFRDQMRSLSDDQRHAFFESGRGEWEGRQRQRMNEFFAMSKADQQKKLDEALNRMLEGQKNSQSGGQSLAGGQGQNNQGQNANGNPGGRGGRSSMTDEQREERSKRRIENSDPTSRAQFAQYRKMLGDRAAQRGISMPVGGGGRPFGPRGA
jgi:hypothetical protein